jgi:hypothetical protein
MPQTQFAARIDSRVKSAVDKYCNSRGLKLSRFVEDALVDKLEELEDVEDLKSIRHEPTRPLSALLKDLGLDGKL